LTAVTPSPTVVGPAKNVVGCGVGDGLALVPGSPDVVAAGVSDAPVVAEVPAVAVVTGVPVALGEPDGTGVDVGVAAAQAAASRAAIAIAGTLSQAVFIGHLGAGWLTARWTVGFRS
jgi:hypothetical protein